MAFDPSLTFRYSQSVLVAVDLTCRAIQTHPYGCPPYGYRWLQAFVWQELPKLEDALERQTDGQEEAPIDASQLALGHRREFMRLPNSPSFLLKGEEEALFSKQQQQ